MIKTYRIIPLAFILFLFGFTLISVAPVFAQTVDQLIERIEKLEAAVFPEGRTGPPPPPMGAPGMPPGPPPHMPPTMGAPGMPGGPGGMPPTGMPPMGMNPGMLGGPGGPPPMPPEVKKCNMMPPGPDKGRCFKAIPCARLFPGAPPHVIADCEKRKAGKPTRPMVPPTTGGMPPTGMPPMGMNPGMLGGPGGPPPLPPELKKCEMMPPGLDKSRCFYELPCDLTMNPALGKPPPEAVASCERNKASMGPPTAAPGMRPTTGGEFDRYGRPIVPGAPGTP